MPNRHAPHSHIAGDPKPRKECAAAFCRNMIELQPTHRPDQDGKVHVRYFDESMRELCHECVAKQFGVEHVSDIAHNHPAVK